MTQFEPPAGAIERISPEELKARLDAGESTLILDVRREVADSQLPHAEPFDPVHLLEIFNPKIDAPLDGLIVAYCT